MKEKVKSNLRTEKMQVALHTCGTGVLLFAIWCLVKVFLSSYLGANIGIDEDVLRLSPTRKIIFVFVCGVIDVALRVYVGHCAILYSQGGKFRRSSLFIAGFIVLYSAIAYILLFIHFDRTLLSLDNIISMAVDVTFIVLNVQIIVFSCLLKKAEG